MATTTLEISGLSEETVKKIDLKAKQEGRAREDYLRDLIERDVDSIPCTDQKSILELFAPVQGDFEQSGMSEDDLDALIDKARADVRQELKAGRLV